MDQWLSSPTVSSLALLVRIAIGGMLTVAGLVKLRGGYERFRGVLEGYAVLPGWAVSLVGHLVPWMELLIGASLLLGVLWPYAAIAASGLLTAFTVALAINVIRGRSDLACGCFGGIRSRPLTWRTVVGRGVMASGSLLVAYAPASWSTEKLEYVLVFALAWAGAWALLRALFALSAEGQGVGR